MGHILEEMGDKISQDLKDKLNKLAEEVRAALASDDIVKIKEKLDELDKALLEVGKTVYEAAQQQRDQQQTQQGPPPQQEGPGETGGEDKGYVDAEYKIVDDEDK